MINKIKKGIAAIKKINALEKKLNLMNNELRMLVPDIIPITDELEKQIKKFEEKVNLNNAVNYSISKNDLMFRYSCYHHGSITEGFYGYLLTGLNGKNIIQKIAEAYYGNQIEKQKILDFAAGYGRVTRFLCVEHSPKQIWAAEIKPKAVEFIQKQFLCNTLQSGFIPEEFCVDIKFDIIYVGSLFSHLPIDLFNRWLKVLYNLLAETGILILSTHDISLIQKKDKNAFVFIEDSEDQMFKEVDDHIQQVGNYGAAFIGENKMKEILASNGILQNQYIRFQKVLSNVQDIYIIGKNKVELKYTPDLSMFP